MENLVFVLLSLEALEAFDLAYALEALEVFDLAYALEALEVILGG